ncbi:MAG: TolC family protein [Planctomycetales bacterium]|nr:TolC family protein [Planctomycetales bacterium]
MTADAVTDPAVETAAYQEVALDVEGVAGTPVAPSGAEAALVNPAAQQVEPLPPVAVPTDAEQGEPISTPPAAVQLDDIVAAIYANYPGLEAATRERQIAAGDALAAIGAFDTQLVGETLTKPLGYYENYRYGLGAKQYTWGGGQVFSGYRLGRGTFEPWYLERETNKGGEFKAGFTLPFLRDRDIDKRRAAVYKARIQQSAAEPIIQLEIINAVQAGSAAYWDWVASGRQLEIAREQLEIAATRQEKIARAVELGSMKGIELVDNERLIVSRRGKLVAAERKLQQSALKLSIYLRSFDGTPLLPTPEQLPADFPPIVEPAVDLLPQQIAQALAMRPEPRLLSLAAEQARVDIQQANNQLLPAIDGAMVASQDVGAPTSSKRDKSQLELEAGLMLDVPLQRREARGKLQATQGKLAQIAAKRRLTEQKIAIEVRHAVTAIAADFLQFQQARRTAELAKRMEDAERTKFEQGNSNILVINLREQATAEAQLLVVAAEADYFRSLAELHAAVAGELVRDGASQPIDMQTTDEGGPP